MLLTRKDFVRLSVISLSAAACGGASTVSDAGSTADAGASTTDAGTIDAGTADAGLSGDRCATAGAKNGSIVGNHGHSLLVPAADFAADGSKTYDITGDSTHGHDITLTAANRASLLAGSTVTVTSTTDSGHAHGVEVVCA